MFGKKILNFVRLTISIDTPQFKPGYWCKSLLNSMNFRTNLILSVFLGLGLYSKAQHYDAIHGSNYLGSLSVYNNPSSIVNSPFKWDLTLTGFQFQLITNAAK